MCTSHAEQCTYIYAPTSSKWKTKTSSESPEDSNDPNVPLVEDRTSIHIAELSVTKPELFLSMNEEFYSQLLETPFYRKSFEFVTLRPTTLPINEKQYIRSVSVDVTFLMTRDDGKAEDLKMLDRIIALAQPNADALLDLYFKFVHPSYPIIHKESFYWKWQRRQVNPALVGSVFLLAINWWNYGPTLASQSIPGTDELWTMCMECYQRLLRKPRLSTVQAGLLLLQNSGKTKRRLIDARTFNFQLVAAAQVIGLHLDCSNWSIPSWEIPPRRKVAWAVFVEDKWLSACYSLPSAINNRDWFVSTLDDDDFEIGGTIDVMLEPRDEGSFLMVGLVRLTVLLSETLDLFYISEAKQPGSRPDLQSITAMGEPLWQRLEEWHQSLPEILTTVGAKSHDLQHGVYLLIMWHAAQCMLVRTMVRYLERAYLSGSLTDKEVESFEWKRRAIICSLNVVGVIRGLQVEDLESFWLDICSACLVQIGSLISVLQLSAKGQQEKEDFDVTRNEFQWKLKLFSRAYPVFEDAFVYLDSSVWKVNDALLSISNR